MTILLLFRQCSANQISNFLALKIRKQVTFAQLKALLEFMREHQELARGLTRGRRGKLHTLKLWNLCAKKLNAIKDGAAKDGKAWSKVENF